MIIGVTSSISARVGEVIILHGYCPALLKFLHEGEAHSHGRAAANPANDIFREDRFAHVMGGDDLIDGDLPGKRVRGDHGHLAGEGVGGAGDALAGFRVEGGGAKRP